MNLQDLIAKRRLRPLGNKERLASIVGETCNACLALFRDRISAERYCDLFIQYARQNPPPCVVETMVAFAPQVVFAEKYAFIYPYPGTGARPEYHQWAQGAIRACNSRLRQHNYSAGEYACVPSNVESVLKWGIVVPRDFNLESPEAQEVLNDPPGGGFKPVHVLGQEPILHDARR